MEIATLPHVDEHTEIVTAEAHTVWRGLGEVLDRSFSEGRFAGYASLVGCPDRAAAGPRPMAEGSAYPGFHVASADPDRELVLVGRHYFSTYALVFRLDQAGPGQIRLRAETRARFPGPIGALYRLLVIGTRGHAFSVRRLLATVRRQAEHVR
ncbi:hypothetical protein [Streptomyces griseorubiginosus]|uniref:hypothetical protein n=1 Tax=Streptomyces griseorubiginosus TaxID=67304 RepID=UPI002E80B9B2|nr:hypothetical protein [Streptomyces griseorubiginosus]WUB48487.1 hypothetical protein OHN19_36160 [Streptomyces griseorubiginosus]WUB57013.1 hypothetical protein OG942_36170 [Streptomyces griseorubiginosus]